MRTKADLDVMRSLVAPLLVALAASGCLKPTSLTSAGAGGNSPGVPGGGSAPTLPGGGGCAHR